MVVILQLTSEFTAKFQSIKEDWNGAFCISEANNADLEYQKHSSHKAVSDH